MAVAKKRKPRNTRNKVEPRIIPWIPMFISFGLGLFIMFLFHLNDNVTPTSTPKKEKMVAKVEKKPNTVEPTFEFYSLLPEMEVVVNDRPTPKVKPAQRPEKVTPDAKPKPVKKVDDTASYLLQVGSFKKLNDADGFKARLAFLGIESKVQTVTINTDNNKVTWHRVQVGPMIGRKKADTVKKQLKQNKIDSLLVRMKRS